MALSNLYDKLNDTESRKWRQTVANSLFLLAAFAVFSAIAMFWGLPLVGGLVWGSDLDKKIQAQIEASNAPIKRDLEQVQASQAQQKASLDDTRKLLIAGIAERYEAQIVEYKTKMCNATTDEARATWRDLVLEYQRRYVSLTGEQFLAPGCAEL